jgi:hypothetical protein
MENGNISSEEGSSEWQLSIFELGNDEKHLSTWGLKRTFIVAYRSSER